MATKTVTGKLTRPGGGAIKGATVVAKISGAAIIASTQEIAPLEETTTTATDGTWSLTLQANLDLLPNDTYYTFKVGSLFERTAIVPQTAGPFKLEDIATTVPPTNIPLNGHVASLLVDGPVTFSAGPVSLPAASIADAALSSNVVLKDNAQTISGVKVFTATPTVPALTLAGLTGAQQPGRLVGTTVYGPPTSGTFSVGDLVHTQTGTQWVCITAGTPGTWIPTSPFYNVKDYGAKGDGITDDAAAINAAIDAAELVGGGTVYMPDGTYIVKSTIFMTGAHSIRLTGAGPETIIRPKATFTGSTVIQITQNTCTLDSFAIIPASQTYTSNPAVDCITINGPASGTVIQNLFLYYHNGWAIKAAPTGTTAWFGIDIKSVFSGSGKAGMYLSGTNASTNTGAVFITNAWMDHTKADDAFFFEDTHDITMADSFAVVDTGGATGSCIHIKGACAGFYIANTDHGGAVGYTGDAILIERNAALVVPTLLTFVGGVAVVQGRGINIYANDSQFIGFTTLNCQTDGVKISGGARLSFTSCSFQNSNLSAGTAYDVNNQTTNFVHLTDCWFNSSAVTASLNGVGGAQWLANFCHATSAATLTAGTQPIMFGQQIASGTPPVSQLSSGLSFLTAATGIANTGGDLTMNAKAASNLLLQVGGSTMAFMGNSAIMNFIANGGIDASSAATLKIGPNNTNLIQIAKAGVLSSFLGEVAAVNLRHQVQNVAFSATPAPDPTAGEMYQMNSLTGAVNVANPVNSVQGQRLKMYWKQDGTGGRAVTYTGTNWRSVGIAAQVTTLNTVTIDEAECVDGTIWRVVRLVTGQTV